MENYPDLKSNQNVLRLQEELTTTENQIAFARQYYNDLVMRYNMRQQVFPSKVIAGFFHFQPSELFYRALKVKSRAAGESHAASLN